MDTTLEALVGFEPTDEGFADLCLTTWLQRLATAHPHTVYARLA